MDSCLELATDGPPTAGFVIQLFSDRRCRFFLYLGSETDAQCDTPYTSLSKLRVSL